MARVEMPRRTRNAEFGASVIHFGAMHGLEDQAPTRIAWTQIPDFDRRVS